MAGKIETRSMIFALEQQRNEIAKKTKHKNTHFKIIGRRESREKNKKIKKIKLKWKRGRNYWFFDSDWKEMIDWSKKRREKKREREERFPQHQDTLTVIRKHTSHPSLFSLFFGETIDPVRCFRERWRGEKRGFGREGVSNTKERESDKVRLNSTQPN